MSLRGPGGSFLGAGRICWPGCRLVGDGGTHGYLRESLVLQGFSFVLKGVCVVLEGLCWVMEGVYCGGFRWCRRESDWPLNGVF